MHKVDHPSADPPNSPTQGQFVDPDPAGGVEGTVAPAAFLNSLANELANVIESRGLTLDKNDDTQLLQALGLAGTIPLTNGFANLFINPSFEIAQRWGNFLVAPVTIDQSTGDLYVPDRWFCSPGTTTGEAGLELENLPAGHTTPPQPETSYLEWNQTVAGGTQPYFEQRIEEGAREHTGRTFTIVGWARATSGSPVLSLKSRIDFGGGGSADDEQTHTGSYTLTTSWQKVTWTVAINSAAGKTIGGSNFLAMQFLFSSGMTFTAELASFACYPGAAEQPWAKRNEALERTLCERYYQSSRGGVENQGAGLSANGAVYAGHASSDLHLWGLQQHFRTVMRATPNVEWYETTSGTAGEVRWDGVSKTVAQYRSVSSHSTGYPQVDPSAEAGAELEAHWTADAEL